MNRFIFSVGFAAIIVTLSQAASADVVTIPYKFTAGSAAVADQVNTDFNFVKTAVDDNYARILGLQTSLSSGNLILSPSTAATGNILKGTTPFLHDYGLYNTFLGKNAGNFTMTGNGNTASGEAALGSNTTGSQNTASGASALTNNTSGEQNTATGWGALQANTEGSQNTATGNGALYYNTTGVNNTATGWNALLTNTDGQLNTAIGWNTLASNTNGIANTATGADALNNNTVGFNNTASGTSALFFNTSGGKNTALGGEALYKNTTGHDNIAIGYRAGYNLLTGYNNIAIGGDLTGAETDTIRLGMSQTRAFIAGIRGVTTGVGDAITVVIDSNGQLGTVSSSRRVKDHILDMGEASRVLMQLRPVTFYYKTDHKPQGRSLQYGLIAEEVAEVAPQLVAHSRDGAIETVYYQHLTPMLLNEYQKQQRTLEVQQALLQQQTAQIAALEQQARELTALKAQVARMSSVLAQRPAPVRVATVKE